MADELRNSSFFLLSLGSRFAICVLVCDVCTDVSDSLLQTIHLARTRDSTLTNLCCLARFDFYVSCNLSWGKNTLFPVMPRDQNALYLTVRPALCILY
jgi:hypothetical protein